MLTIILIFLSFYFSFSHQQRNDAKDSATINANDDAYLPRGQLMFHYNLSGYVTFDRKPFRDVWIYKNGFVTLGLPLEEEHYPTMTDSGGIDQPFENMIGANIIAVFITTNEMRANSGVFARQMLIKSQNFKERKTLVRLEQKIKDIYERFLIEPLEHVFEVEWRNVAPFGVDKDKENSFHLFFLGNRAQTFCVFQYSNIQSITYKKLDKWLPYQSGIRSYSYIKFTLPQYDVKDRSVPLDKSSNIGIRNTWLIMIGDSSYNMDIGWPMTNMDANLLLLNRVPYSKSTKNKGINSKFRSTRSMRKSSANKKFKLQIKSEEPNGIKYQAKILSRKTSRKKTVAPRILHPDQLSERKLKDHAKLIYKKTTKSNLMQSTISREQNMTRNFKVKGTFDVPLNSSFSRLTSLYTKPILLGRNELLKLEILVRSSHSSRTSGTHGKEQDDISYNNSQSIRKNKRFHQKRSSINKPSNLKNMEVSSKPISGNSHDQEKPDMSIVDSVSPIDSGRSSSCSKELCKENEECFLTTNGPCCKCLRGSVFLDKRCIAKKSLFSINSRGIVRLFSMGVQTRLDLSLIITKRTLSNENFQRSHLTLISDNDLSLEIRNFLLILYPVFYVPMSFYAFPWGNETVPNLSALVDELAGIQIQLTAGSHENIYILFKLERKDNDDKWTIKIQGIDTTKVKALNLENRKLDEKSTGTHNLFYNLMNQNSIEYPEQTVFFYDEINNSFLNIRWRGSMTFSATCLANHIANKRYYVKFSEKRYCNSDCILNKEANKTNCRMMCLSSPHVFDTSPDPCHGNFCGPNKTCINLENRYECKCLEGFHEIGDRCVKYSLSTTLNSLIPTAKKERYGCSFCSENSNCRVLNYQECCICKRGYTGSGILCIRKDSQHEINSFGTIKIIPYVFQPSLERSFNLRFRQWKRDNEIHFANLIEIDGFPYSSVTEKKVLHLVLLLSPLYDIPSALFAKNLLSQVDTENIYIISKGIINLKIKIESTILSTIEINININEGRESFDTDVSIIGIATINIDDKVLSEATEYFNRRNIGNISYSIKDNMVTFEKHDIQLPSGIRQHKMWWYGTAELSNCADIYPKKLYLVVTSAQSRCNARCNRESCSPYCQASQVVQLISTEMKCLQVCHSAASCFKGRCVCRTGFSGNGIICRLIRKTLECRKSKDCIHKPFTKCRNRRCVCENKFGSESINCRETETCSSCEINETCLNGKCVCKPTFVRNRISQSCVFDCSLCDLYSTKCSSKGCVCKTGFVTRNLTDTSCVLGCTSDTDCPTQEICDSSKICVCPHLKENGLCQRKLGCDICHQKALCQGNECKCEGNWFGDGISCSFNCSLCFSNRFCNPETGCICPNGLRAKENECTIKQCYGKCSNRSSCQNVQNTYKCICFKGLVMIGDECVDDVVQLNILPFGPKIDVFEGADLDLICLGVPMTIELNLDWSRKSGKPIQGFKEFIDNTNKTLRLRLHSLRLVDSDKYICSTAVGKQTEVEISINKAVVLCEERCHEFGYCENGMCKCLRGYLGNGIHCIPVRKCSTSCAEDEICDWKTGQCVCQPGFVKSKMKCWRDCRKQHDLCDRNAQCNRSTGTCECMKEYVGNGTNCWRLENCLLTKRCVSNSTCTLSRELNYHLCVCDKGFVGDGSVLCHREIDCASYHCGPNSLCEQNVVKDAFGNLLRNGKCLCRLGYVLIDNVCQDQSQVENTLWVSIGESLIRLKLGETTKSSIRYIDLPENNGDNTTGIITTLAWGGCKLDRLIWSSQNGVNLKSAPIGNLSDTITHLSNLGKVTGISMDQETGNLFFSDSHNGRIGVVNIIKNISKTLLEIRDYTPGQILAHSRSGKLFWIVNDYKNPRIEWADMTGENRHIFIALNNQAISLVIAQDSSDASDRLCWIELNKQSRTSRVTPTSTPKAVIRCTDTSRKDKLPVILNIHRIHNEEPFSGFAFFNQTFYWSVRNGAFIRSWGRQNLRLDIRPNCCDSGVRGLIIKSEYCIENHYTWLNPCSQNFQINRCPQLCVPRINTTRQVQVEAVCLGVDP